MKAKIVANVFGYIAITCVIIAALLTLYIVIPSIIAFVWDAAVSMYAAFQAGDMIFGGVLPLVFLAVIFVWLRDIALCFGPKKSKRVFDDSIMYDT